MKRGFDLIIFFLFLQTITLQSCTKENEGLSLNYKLYLDSQNRFIRITESLSGSGPGSTTLYDYSENAVIISDANYRYTYFVDETGLADSCLIEDISFMDGWRMPSVIYFKYNPDGYLEFDGFGSYTYKYYEGNRIEALQDTSIIINRRHYYYNYYPLPNMIDLDQFRGAYLGKPGRNLVSELRYSDGTMKEILVKYSYILDKNGYVLSRTETWNNNKVTIRKYEYFFDK